MAAHQASPSLGFSRQEHWSGLPFPSPMHESESEVAQSCLTLSDPMDCSPPGSSAHGIFQARVLEWGAIAFSDRGYRLLHVECGKWNLRQTLLHLMYLKYWELKYMYIVRFQKWWNRSERKYSFSVAGALEGKFQFIAWLIFTLVGGLE